MTNPTTNDAGGAWRPIIALARDAAALEEGGQPDE
jgi:hypothetical protein